MYEMGCFLSCSYLGLHRNKQVKIKEHHNRGSLNESRYSYQYKNNIMNYIGKRIAYHTAYFPVRFSQRKFRAFDVSISRKLYEVVKTSLNCGSESLAVRLPNDNSDDVHSLTLIKVNAVIYNVNNSKCGK